MYNNINVRRNKMPNDYLNLAKVLCIIISVKRKHLILRWITKCCLTEKIWITGLVLKNRQLVSRYFILRNQRTVSIMRSRNGEFGIFKRKSRGHGLYYYWIYDNYGKRKYRSTRKKDYNEALKYCRALQMRGRLHQGTCYSFDVFTRDFFVFEKCPYIQNRLLRGYSYGRSWAQRQRNILTKIIQPHFGSTDIRNSSPKEIDDFILHIKQTKKGNKTINHILATIKAIFSYAERIGIK